MKQKLLFLLMALFISGCSGKTFFEPTQTATPLPTPLPTLTPTIAPTQTAVLTRTPYPTRDPLLEYLPSLPQIPSGFSWKMAQDLNVIFLMPDDWFFNRQYCPAINFYETTFLSLNDMEQACISKENPLEVGKYSVGQAVVIYKNVENADDFAKYILHVLATSPEFGLLSADTTENTKDFLDKFPPEIYIRDVHTTTKIIKAFDYTTDQYVVHHLRVEASYLHESGTNKSKTVQYSTLAYKDKVYLLIFEAPSAEWDATMKDYQLLLDYFVIL